MYTTNTQGALDVAEVPGSVQRLLSSGSPLHRMERTWAAQLLLAGLVVSGRPTVLGSS